MAASWPGTLKTWTPLADDGSEDLLADSLNSAYLEITAMQASGGAGTSITSDGGLRLTLQHSSVTVGYAGEGGGNDVAGVARILVPDGSWDVAAMFAAMFVVKTSSGVVDAGFTYCANDDSVIVHDDGAGNQLTLAVSSSGEATLQRTAGTLTYDVLWRGIWL